MSPDRRARFVSIAAVAAVCALGAVALPRLSVTTEITDFLPESEDRELARIAQEMASSDLNRTITLTLEAPDRATAIAASRELAERLGRRPEVEWARRGPSEDVQQAFYELYFSRRLLFFATDASEIAARTSEPALAEAARDLKRRLTSPVGTLVRQLAPRDPLLGYLHHVERLRDAQAGGLVVHDGQLMTADGRHGVIFLASRASPFESAASRRLLAGIDEDFAGVRAAHGDVRLEQSGVHRFAVASEDAIRADVTRISVAGSIGVVLLFLVLFRSPRYLALGAVPLVLGGVAGLSVTQLAFGRVHGLGLAFGATLIGVAIDYVAHYLNHHTLEPSPDGAAGSVRRIWPGLALGAATTMAGLSGLAWTSFPGIRELAVFTSVGVLVALLATRYVLPPWMPDRPTPTRLHAALARRLERALGWLRGSLAVRAGVPAIALLVVAVGLARLEWVDDVRVLNTLDAALLAEDERVRERVSRMDAGRFVMAWADDDETALQRNDEVHRRLRAAGEAGEVAHVRSLASFLPSARTQRESLLGLREAPRLVERLSRALEAEGFVAPTFAPFGEDLAADPPPLTWDDVAGSPLAPLVSSFRVELDDGRVAFLTMLRGGELEALDARLAGLEGVRLFDQGRFLESAYGRFRSRTLEMMGVGLVAMLLLLVIRYRELLPALAAFVPAVLAASTALAVLVLVGTQATLMHLVALLLVLSMGADYGIFLVEVRRRGEVSVGPTITSLVVACLSTVLSFGLLAMSSIPALRALGTVTGLGVLLSLVLAPTAWLLLPERR